MVIFTTEGGAKSWHGKAVKSANQRKCLLDGCDDWEVSAGLPEWDSHLRIIKETRLRPDIGWGWRTFGMDHGHTEYDVILCYIKQNFRSNFNSNSRNTASLMWGTPRYLL